MAGEALIPRFGWLGRYGGSALVRDVIAGLILSILLVPQAMAYAQLAGLPPETGLFAAILPPVLYLLFGTSAFVSMGPVALVSLIVGEAIAANGGPGGGAVLIIAVEAGLILLAVGAAGLGRLVNFVSEPALLGFTAGAAFLIADSQLPTLMGMEVARAGDLPTGLSHLLSGMNQFSWPATIIGGAALTALIVIGKLAPPLLWKLGVHPPYRQAIAKSLPLAIIVAAALAATHYPPAAVPRVEPVAAGLPGLPVLAGGWSLWLTLLPSALAVAVIIFVTATAVAKSLAGSDRSSLDTSREAVALGAANIGAALTGGYAVGASLSRSALIEDSGARSPVASVVASGIVVLTLLLLAPLLAFLPKTALAALVISAVFGLIKPRAIRFVWRHDVLEGLIVLICFLATLALGVRWGLAIGAGVSILHFLWFSSVPRVTRVGTDDGGQSYRSVDREDVEVRTLPALVVRIDRSIFFGNEAHVEDQVFKRMAQHEGVECLVLDMRAVNDVDASGVAMLRRLGERLERMDIALHFAALHEPVHEKLRALDQTICNYHRTVGQAVDSCGVCRQPD
ncbi:SulP family inorganic anion transporter [Aurantiacibacter spongiae]|uniref:STAS domain-containing protein n=1 Tax=Aurantiacibacter spongiae TaxID=2488860 RepID=A0A3N5CYX1_9SPHN|nr:SulP family inorganic anion transporter [Aurantiacibacter spongiae]RPF71899.1 STAS domain-containing protein [Aurantiacibacter spongiae]